ncbi:hypothetical protein GCM10010489_03430 [Microbacterium saperdae]|nr:hypothetical protein GCM10010489_03430 [Microbacterium saperdae]
MRENVSAAVVGGDEAEALLRVEPLDRALGAHVLPVLLVKKPTQVCPDIANASGGGPQGNSRGQKVTQMLHERNLTDIR